jgi:hypothetical protein
MNENQQMKDKAQRLLREKAEAEARDAARTEKHKLINKTGLSLADWLDGVFGLDDGSYNNNILGKPHCRNEQGIYNLYYLGMSPEEALTWWRQYSATDDQRQDIVRAMDAVAKHHALQVKASEKWTKDWSLWEYACQHLVLGRDVAEDFVHGGDCFVRDGAGQVWWFVMVPLEISDVAGYREAMCMRDKHTQNDHHARDWWESSNHPAAIDSIDPADIR